MIMNYLTMNLFWYPVNGGCSLVLWYPNQWGLFIGALIPSQWRLFSLSLFLSVCIMAPKHKSTPSQNPLHSRASSSNSTSSHLWFYDEKTRKDFSENFSWRGIHAERQVILLDFFDTDLPTVIYSRGWESLCGVPITFPSVIIQDFYSNIHGFDYSVPHFITRVQGMRIVITSDIVSEVLHVPRVAHPNYHGYDRLKSASKDKLMSLFCETPSS